mmetsp:Transcript_121685/g.378789  ORF Transcript_121685/g.378789 Transcript_121685/m.378789 type:complete len:366 (-) Transcript_121685:26-1123(-)
MACHASSLNTAWRPGSATPAPAPAPGVLCGAARGGGSRTRRRWAGMATRTPARDRAEICHGKRLLPKNVAGQRVAESRLRVRGQASHGVADLLPYPLQLRSQQRHVRGLVEDNPHAVLCERCHAQWHTLEHAVVHVQLHDRGAKAAQQLRDPGQLPRPVHAKEVHCARARVLLVARRLRQASGLRRTAADGVDLQRALRAEELHHLCHAALGQDCLEVHGATQVLQALVHHGWRDLGAKGAHGEADAVEVVIPACPRHAHKGAARGLDVGARCLHDTRNAAPDLAAAGDVDLPGEGQNHPPHLILRRCCRGAAAVRSGSAPRGRSKPPRGDGRAHRWRQGPESADAASTWCREPQACGASAAHTA